MRVRMINETRGTVLANKIKVANTFFARLMGLMGKAKPFLPKGCGLLLDPCKAIHTWFMRFPIDVVFLDEQGEVVGIEEKLAPWRLSRVYHNARCVLELPAGTVRDSQTRVGDKVRW